jgi:hypothetical protein
MINRLPTTTREVAAVETTQLMMMKTSSSPTRPPLRLNLERIRTLRSTDVNTASVMAYAGIQVLLLWGKFVGGANDGPPRKAGTACPCKPVGDPSIIVV